MPLCLQVQLIRIQVRVPEYGWTTQKVFHLLNAVVCTLRSCVFFFRPQLDSLSPEILKLLLLDLPGDGIFKQLARCWLVRLQGRVVLAHLLPRQQKRSTVLITDKLATMPGEA